METGQSSQLLPEPPTEFPGSQHSARHQATGEPPHSTLAEANVGRGPGPPAGPCSPLQTWPGLAAGGNGEEGGVAGSGKGQATAPPKLLKNGTPGPAADSGSDYSGSSPAPPRPGRQPCRPSGLRLQASHPSQTCAPLQARKWRGRSESPGLSGRAGLLPEEGPSL